MANEKFQKQPQLGVNLENGFFSADGTAGFNMSAYGGFLTLTFWRKGEKAVQNTNKLMLNINQTLFLSKILGSIVNQRYSEFKAGGSETYSDITNYAFSINGVINGQNAVFGILKFDTVEVDGIKRIRMNLSKDSYDISIVFSDRFMGSIIPHDSNIKPTYDVMDTSLMRFFSDLAGYVNFSWQQGAFNKIYSTLTGDRNGNQSRPSQNYRSERSNEKPSGGNSKEIFDDDTEF